MIRALIADDEPLAREALRDAIGAGAEIVAECANGAEAAEAMQRLQPDVAFLDIEMPGLDGLAAVRGVEHPPAIVFVTAYDEYAVEAFALEAVDYILKPVDEGRVAEALRRVKARQPVPRPRSVEQRFGDQRFVVGAHGKLIVVAANEVRFFEAAGNYVRLHTAAASPLLRGTLAAIEQRLDPRRFVRVHRSFIVNLGLIAELQLTRSGDYEVVLKEGGKVPMSRTFRDAVLEAIRA
ncbi:MAG TPA: LytTR family DNA-binding domain-containing protein [Thermoanaerobaculia bacterium]|nr:LytTR family DNA-binding domain-containing protein [Thermoanaerobaculia bacterium]